VTDADDEGQPIGYQVLPRGTPVVTRDGVRVGTVAKVLDNAREHIFDGILVRVEGRQVFVDAPEVERITDRRVSLTIDASEVAQLPDHRGWMGRMEASAKQRATRMKRRFGG
jgi:hypothetical protein